MSGEVVVDAFAVGGALLGFWFTVRFPERGPQSMGGALLWLFGALVWLNASVPLFTFAVGAVGLQAALLLVLLPAVAGFFWAAGCTIRVCAGLTSRYR